MRKYIGPHGQLIWNGVAAVVFVFVQIMIVIIFVLHGAVINFLL